MSGSFQCLEVLSGPNVVVQGVLSIVIFLHLIHQLNDQLGTILVFQLVLTQEQPVTNLSEK